MKAHVQQSCKSNKKSYRKVIHMQEVYIERINSLKNTHLKTLPEFKNNFEIF